MMRRYIFLLFSFFLLRSANVCGSSLLDTFAWAISDSKRTEVLQREWGHQDLSPEHVALVESIKKKLGIDQPIVIKKMNRHAMQTYGWHNAFAIYEHIFISENFFTELPYEQQEFLIGHELMHIKQNFSRKSLGVLWAGYGLSIMATLLAKKHFDWPWWKAAFLCAILNNLTVGYNASYRRWLEYDADAGSVNTLGCFDGARACLELFQTLESPSNWFQSWFVSHPLCSDRMNEIEQLQSVVKGY